MNKDNIINSYEQNFKTEYIYSTYNYYYYWKTIFISSEIHNSPKEMQKKFLQSEEFDHNCFISQYNSSRYIIIYTLNAVYLVW